MHPFEQLREHIRGFNASRPVFDLGTANTWKKLEELKHEATEAQEEAVKPESPERNLALERELADVLIVLLTIANKEGFELLGQAIMKMMRNEVKYAMEHLQEGDYFEKVAFLKQYWADIGGDEAYFKDKGN